jgi:probable F420-dependent oxidoreductase
MRIGIIAILSNPFATPDYIAQLGSAAEERRIASIWVPEHVVLFDDPGSRYPYSPDGRLPGPAESGPIEPFGVLAYLASCTRTVRLGTGVCLLPQRNPVYAAKEAATVDWLSNGRLDFGIGVGWLAEEFASLGVPFERRGARARAYVEVMRRLWCDPVSEYAGEFYTLPPCRQYPKPVQRPHPPLHFGGESDAALRRAADVGQGWYGFNLRPDAAAERIAALRSLLAARGRGADALAISVTPEIRTPLVPDDLKRYRDAGVEQLVAPVLAPGRDAMLQALDRVADLINAA